MEVNKKQLADIFGASIRTIQNWQEQGMPVLRGGGKGMPPTPSSCIRIISSGLFSGSVIAQAGA
ncbi:terminase small subunit, partial [Escherichia coli]